MKRRPKANGHGGQGAQGGNTGGNGNAPFGAAPGGSAETTGRFLVLFRDDATEEGVKMLRAKASINAVSAIDRSDDEADDDVAGRPAAAAAAAAAPTREEPDAVFYDDLGVAVVRGDPRRARAIAAAVDSSDDSPIAAIEPERIVYAFGPASPDEGDDDDATATLDPSAPPEAAPREPIMGLPAPMLDDLLQPPPARPGERGGGATPRQRAQFTADYLYGYRDAILSLIENLRGEEGTAGSLLLDREAAIAAIDESLNTWGLQATRVVTSRYSGKGVRVAVLDTGFDLRHPDFLGRQVFAKSFVPGQGVQDGNGHGTHCIGTACGPKTPAILPRYGVAYRSGICAGKVLSNQGSGQDGWILAGIQWAIKRKCRVVSMSLGARVRPGETYSRVYESVARRALRLNTLIVAAAGNDSDRPNGDFWPVSHPANCPSIAAVGAVDSGLGVAPFSNRGLNPAGGRVDIAGPGVNVYSSVPMPTRYRRLSGTSMATPHVAGIAALWAQQSPAATAVALYHLLVSNARPLTDPNVDVGAGLVQAPQ
jgi:subtilisin family serine protease